MEAQLIESIKSIFEPFFNECNFSVCTERFSGNLCFKNETYFMEFVYDLRNDEIGIIVYFDQLGRYVSLLYLIEDLTPDDYLDVFKYLKSEFETPHFSLVDVKHQSDYRHDFLLISVCSVMMKNHETILNKMKNVLN